MRTPAASHVIRARRTIASSRASIGLRFFAQELEESLLEWSVASTREARQVLFSHSIARLPKLLKVPRTNMVGRLSGSASCDRRRRSCRSLLRYWQLRKYQLASSV